MLPKPLMPVDERPILEIMIRQLVSQGFDRITITLGYLGALIMAVLGDGRRLGAQIEYVHEDRPARHDRRGDAWWRTSTSPSW